MKVFRMYRLSKINIRKIKQVPARAKRIWFVLTLLSLYFLVQLFLPLFQSLEQMDECEITIDQVCLVDSKNTRGSRMKLEIISDGHIFYVWYPQSKYLDYAPAVENELLSGEVTQVTAKIAPQSLRDRLEKRVRIIELKSAKSVYYDLNIEKMRLQSDRVGIVLALILTLVIWAILTIVGSIVFGIIEFSKRGYSR